MEAIRCTDLVKEYHTQETVRALDGVNLSVETGEVFGLLGPNGAGKTTLVRILATLLRATSGQAIVGGYDVERDERRVRDIIGYAGQDSERSGYFRLTVYENLLYFAHALRGLPLAVARERILEVAEGMGLPDRLGQHFSSLSGGQKQLVVVVRALLHRPQVVFLDEPSKSLDPVTSDRVRRFVVAYARQFEMTVLLTTHNMEEAEDICDRLAFINKGRLQFVGTPREFKRSVIVQETVEVDIPLDNPVVGRLKTLPGVNQVSDDASVLRLYCDDAYSLLHAVITVLDNEGVKATVRMVEPSLEDAFCVLVANHEKEQHG